MVTFQSTAIPKKFVLTVLVASGLFVGAYLAWTVWVSPRPEPVTTEVVSTSQDAPQLPTPNPTIVTAAVNKDGIPETLGALTLTKSEQGKDALSEFEKLHGKGFDLLGGFRADYASKDQMATLWVGQAKDAPSAQAMATAMADKIGAGNPMFTDLQELSIADRALYTVNGQGQQHFFYAQNDKIVWLAIDPALAPDALHSLWGAVK